MDLNGIKDPFDRVAKKQKLSTTKTQEVIDVILKEIGRLLEMMQSDQSPTTTATFCDGQCGLGVLKNRLQEIDLSKQLEGPQKELNVALNKYVKQLDKSFNADVSKAHRSIDFDTRTINQIIACHLYRQGHFEIGDCFAREAGEAESYMSVRSGFSEMHVILAAMQHRNLKPAIDWAETNSNKLKADGSDLQLKLHCLHFTEILQNRSSRSEALEYLKTHISPFAPHHIADIQKMMACFMWAGKLNRSPYAHLLSPANWKAAAEELTEQFCSFLGQSSQSPLSVAIAAGFQSLPLLLKLMNVMVTKKHDWQSMQQLPVPIDLGKEFQFHSVFVCPISKDQSTIDNPPMLMPCGHVLCRQSLHKMLKNGSKHFKCPLCPRDVDSTLCKQLYL